MVRCFASINDLPIKEAERNFSGLSVAGRMSIRG
jgi:nuclear transport factor 2 (NTF2) superfamily protein